MRKEPALLAMSLVYLVQGLSDMAWLAEKYFLKDDLGASPAQVSLFLSLASVPWMVKPLLGFISDSLPLWGYRRRSYLLLASAAAAGSWVYLAVGATSLSSTLWAMVLGSGAVALSDVVVDSMVVEKAREEEQDSAGNLQSLCWAAYAVGQVATAALSGSLVEAHGPRFVFGLTAAFPLLIGAASMMVHEERVTAEAALRGLTASLEETWSSDDEGDWEGGGGWEAAAGAAGAAGVLGATSLPLVAAAAEADRTAQASSSGRGGAAADYATGANGANGAGTGNGNGAWAAWSSASARSSGSSSSGAYGGSAATQAATPLQPEPGGMPGAAAAGPDTDVAAAAAARARVAAAALFASPPSLPPPPTAATSAVPDDWGPPAAPLPGSPCLGGLAPPPPAGPADAAAVTPFALLPAVSSASLGGGGGGLALSLLPPPAPADIPCPTTAALHTTPASPRGRHRRPGGSRTHKPLPSPSALAAASALLPRPHPPSLAERGAALAAAAAGARSSMLSHGAALWSALSAPAIAWPVTFLMLLSATPAADDAVFFFEVEALGFTPSFLGAVQLAIAVASLGGVWLYNAAFKGVPLRSFLLWGNLLGAALQCSDLLLVARVNTWLGLDDRLFVLGGSVVTSVITNVLSMPTLVLAARLCPKGLEATMFATIMSLLNMADGVRYAGGAGLMAALGVSGGSYDNLPLLVGLCNAALLLPLPVLVLVPAGLDCAELAASAGASAAGSAAASRDGGAGRRAGAGEDEDECELSGLEEEEAAAVPVPVPVPEPEPLVQTPVAAAVATVAAASASAAPAVAVLAPVDSVAAAGGAAAEGVSSSAAADGSAATPGTVSGRSRSPHKKPQPHLHPHSHFGDPIQHQPLSEQTWRQGWDPNWPPPPPQQLAEDGGGDPGGGNGGAGPADRRGMELAAVQAGSSGSGNGNGGAGSETGAGEVKANGHPSSAAAAPSQTPPAAASESAAGGGEGEAARVVARGP